MKSFWIIWVGSKSKGTSLYKKKRKQAGEEKHREEGDVKMEAETEVINLKPGNTRIARTAARRKAQTDSSSEAPGGTNPADTSIWASALYSCGRIHFCYFKPPGCENLLC